MADVFLAVAPGPVGLNKLVVIKQLRDNRQDDDFLDMFLNEAHIAARLNHPNVIHLYEASHHATQLYLVMEYLNGQALQRIRGQLGTKDLPLNLHLRILCDALLGLHYAHDLCDYDGTPLGIVHRDMSPQNLFVTYDGTTKVLDFGIAKALNQTVHTRVGGVKGKIQYMSPEQARGVGHTVDRRSDLFTMGVLLWEAAVGRRLWKGEDEVIVFQHLVKGDPIVPPRTVNPDVHPQLERICMRALDVDRERRYPNAEEMRAEIEDFLIHTGQPTTAKDVGQYIFERFSEERESIRATIDSALKSGAPSSRDLTLEPTASSGAGTLAPAQGTQPSLPLTIEPAPQSIPTISSSVGQPAIRTWHLALMGIVAVTVGALGFGALTRDRGAPTSVLSTVKPAVPAPQSAAAPSEVPPDETGDPSPTLGFLDERPLRTGASAGPLPRATGKHKGRTEVSGRLPGSGEASLDIDSMAQHPVTQKPPVGRPAVVTPRPSPTAPASAGPLPRAASTKRPPVVSIDTENPW